MKKKTTKDVKKRGSFATYRDKKDKNLFFCNLNELADKLLDWGNTPTNINNTRAFELRLLAEDYIKIRKELYGK